MTTDNIFLIESAAITKWLKLPKEAELLTKHQNRDNRFAVTSGLQHPKPTWNLYYGTFFPNDYCAVC